MTGTGYALLIALGVVAGNTNALAAPQTVTVTIALGADAAHTPAASGADKAVVGDTLTITCPPNTHCADLGVKAGLADLKPGGTITVDTWSGTVGGASDISITWQSGGAAVSVKTVNISAAPVTVPAGNGTPPNGGGGGGGGTGTPSGLFTDCPASIPTALDQGAILVDTQGNVLATKLSKLSEEDTVVIWVVGSESSFAGLSVKKTSAFRDVTVLRILGNADVVIPGPKQGLNDPIRCMRFELADFSAGRGAFAINNSLTKTSVEVEFAVRPRYQGMFTVAFIGSWLKRPSFSVRGGEGTGSIARDPGDSVDGRYALMYTAFLPLQSWFGGRISDPEWNQRVGLSAGVLLDAPATNALFGVSFGPINGLSLVLGIHAGEVEKLDGVVVGDTLALDAKVPTKTEWQAGFFVGASVDIRVATKLFFSLFTK